MQRSRKVAIVLAVVLGTFGVHRYYLGKPRMGRRYWLFCWTGFPTFIAWGEAVWLLLMSEELFADKFPGAPWGSTEPVKPKGPSVKEAMEVGKAARNMEPGRSKVPLEALKVSKSFGALGGCKVKIENGYIEVKGLPLKTNARVPIEAVEVALVRRTRLQPQLVLIGRGAELGHTDLDLGHMKGAERAAEWINDLLRRYR